MTKQELRKQVANSRNALTPTMWRAKSDIILQHLRQSNAYQMANYIFTFISIKSEVDTRALICAAQADGKHVAVPVTAANGQMYFAPITPETILTQTKTGTLEPDLPPHVAVCPSVTDLFLVPGLVFDKKGNRYGYGGGFYDRYLQRQPQVTPIAVAFSLQISAQTLCVEPHDIAVAAIVTEDGWLNTIR